MSKLKKEIQLKISEISEDSKNTIDNFIEIIKNNRKYFYVSSDTSNNLFNITN